MTTLVLLGAIVLAILWGIGIYNGLIALRNGYKSAFSGIDVQLKRRYDLIPNLVETAKGYMKHERETLEAVIVARNSAVSAQQKASAAPDDPNAVRNLLQAEGALTGSMNRLFALAEAYPDLKANTNMLQLQTELSQTESLIAAARSEYNATAASYNTKREIFPNVIIANMFGFQPAVLFEVSVPAEREPVKVSF